MPITDPLVLPPDVVLRPLKELPPDLQGRFSTVPDGYAIFRARARAAPKLVGGDAARLIGAFREPCTIVDALKASSGSGGFDPVILLEDTFPALRDCYNAGFLVPEGSPRAHAIEPLLCHGDRFGGYRIVRLVHVVEDVEGYQVRDRAGHVAFLKVARPGWSMDARQRFSHEARVLDRLGGRCTPCLYAQAEDGGIPYITMSWCSGASPTLVASELRDAGEHHRPALLTLCRAITRAYAELHGNGVVHGDVQPGNLLVAQGGDVTILDFALAQVEGDATTVPRGGVTSFIDPDLARAMLDGSAAPAATPASDQYALGALLYLLLTGKHYAPLAGRRDTCLRRILRCRPLPFVQQHVEAWPEIEFIVGRALRKQESGRFSSTAALADALAVAGVPSAGARVSTAGPVDVLAQLRRRLVRRLSTRRRMFRLGPGAAPTCSVMHGAAGIAYGLYHMAVRRQSAAALSLADAWACKAARGIGQSDAFYGSSPGMRPDAIGPTSVFHAAPGVHSVCALISLALGDRRATRAALKDFLNSSQGDGPLLDLTLGRPGFLLGGALLLQPLDQDLPVLRQQVVRAGEQCLESIWSCIRRQPPIPSCTTFGTLGIAHGWAGALFATLRWCAVAGSPYPDGLVERLRELARLSEPAGRGLQWPRIARSMRASSGQTPDASWCNGTSGHVQLWTEAFRCLGADEYRTLAIQSAWHVWEARGDHPSLCCGLAGRAYALLSCYRITGDALWLRRAGALARRAAEVALGRDKDRYAMSLYKGHLGIATLAIDLRDPSNARMPFFEAEGWPRLQTAR